MLLQANGLPVTSAKRKVQVKNPGLARVASLLHETLGPLQMSAHCPLCNSGLQGANHPSDDTWTLECDCTVRVMPNPHRTH
jgi:hypothetical protein